LSEIIYGCTKDLFPYISENNTDHNVKAKDDNVKFQFIDYFEDSKYQILQVNPFIHFRITDRRRKLSAHALL
jgi:hypothetical protein